MTLDKIYEDQYKDLVNVKYDIDTPISNTPSLPEDLAPQNRI